MAMQSFLLGTSRIASSLLQRDTSRSQRIKFVNSLAIIGVRVGVPWHHARILPSSGRLTVVSESKSAHSSSSLLPVLEEHPTPPFQTGGMIITSVLPPFLHLICLQAPPPFQQVAAEACIID